MKERSLWLFMQGFLPAPAHSQSFCTYPRDPSSPMLVLFTDFRAQCRHYLYTWIPRGTLCGLMFQSEFPPRTCASPTEEGLANQELASLGPKELFRV